MGPKSEITTKIQLLSNRIRCSRCNAGAADAIFMVTTELKFRSSIAKPSSDPMCIRGTGLARHMRINRVQDLEDTEILTRVCLRCGTSRRTSIPNS